MADKRIKLPGSFIEGKQETAIGKTVLVYNTYANALAFGSTGLIDVTKLFAIDPLDESKGTAITQAKGGTETSAGTGDVTPDTGVDVDLNGIIQFVLDDDGGGTTEVFIASNTGNGRQPIRIDVANADSI